MTGWFVSSSTGRAGSQCEEDEEGARIDDVSKMSQRYVKVVAWMCKAVLIVVKKDKNKNKDMAKVTRDTRCRRDGSLQASSKPPERWPDARIHHWCAMCIDFAGTTPIIIMEHAREKTIGGVLLQTRVHP